MPKKCPSCKQPITSKNPKVRYCSLECRQKHTGPIGVTVHAPVGTSKYQCPVCSGYYQANYKHVYFCSERCWRVNVYNTVMSISDNDTDKPKERRSKFERFKRDVARKKRQEREEHQRYYDEYYKNSKRKKPKFKEL